MNRLNLITLGVKDMVESLAFYRDGLGFDVVVYGEESDPEVIFSIMAEQKYPCSKLIG